jgi:hypothetical protein
MGALATAVANKTLDHLNLTAAYTPTGPLKLRLMTVNGSAAAAGIEVTGGTYASQTIEFAVLPAALAAVLLPFFSPHRRRGAAPATTHRCDS